MVPIETLRREHRLIVSVLDAAEYEVEQIARRGGFDTAVVGGFMDFFRVFVHGLHGAKEVYHLFVFLERRMVASNQRSLVPFLRSYDECRRQLQAIAGMLLPSIQGDYWTALSLSEHVSAYCQQMRAQIDREEAEIFPLAESLLKPGDEEALMRDFRTLSRKVGVDTIHRQRCIARELARSTRLDSAQLAGSVEGLTGAMEIHFG